MTFQNRFQYVGLKPYEDEHRRVDAGEMTHHEYELLSQDETYRKLAELRWFIAEFERELGENTALAEATRANLFYVVAGVSVTLSESIDDYVERWLNDHREARRSKA